MIKNKLTIMICAVGIAFSLATKVMASDETQRIWGKDRYGTAIEVSKSGWTNGSEYAILANGENFPDALSATPLAKKYNAPILLNPGAILDTRVESELKRLGVKQVFIIGGPAVVPDSVKSGLEKLNVKTTRLWGQNRYETSIKVAEQLDFNGQVSVANGEGFTDALSISPIAAQKSMPVILTPPNNLPEVVDKYIKSNKITKTYIIGEKDVVSDDIANSFPNSERIWGSSKYDTNIAVLNRFKNDIDIGNIYFANGENFPDALAGSALAAKNSSSILLVDNKAGQTTKDFMVSNIDSKCKINILGGEAVIPNELINNILYPTDNMPQINSCKFEFTPLLPTEKQEFYIDTKNAEDVQYRIFVHGYLGEADSYTEITDGYTSAVQGKITSTKTLESGSNGEGQKYKVIIYVKRTNVKGSHSDLNTDYDNYYVDYFRCVDSVSKDNNIYTKYNISLGEMVSIQSSLKDKPRFITTGNEDDVADANQIKYYVNPNNFVDDYGKYQFLSLNYAEGLTVEEANELLKGKGILEEKGQAFLDAAKTNNVNPAYLIAHALHETGNGESVLANGGKKDSSGSYIYGVPVYNFFGIGAVDGNAVDAGTKTAYDNKWLTPEDAIKGGAEWISSNYINNLKNKQDTLYKMRWNPANAGEHQYATNVVWAYSQISNIIKEIKVIISEAKDLKLVFDIPVFK